MPRLVFTGKDFGGRTHDLTREVTRVGRRTGNDLVIVDPSISDHHCEILTSWGTQVIVRDTGSRNGTYLEGVRITGQKQVWNGQVLRFGSVEARLELLPSEMEDQPTATDTTIVSWTPKPAHPVASAPDVIAPDHVEEEVDRTMIMPPGAAPAAASPAMPNQAASEPACAWRWIWLGVGAIVLAAVVWILFIR